MAAMEKQCTGALMPESILVCNQILNYLNHPNSIDIILRGLARSATPQHSQVS